MSHIAPIAPEGFLPYQQELMAAAALHRVVVVEKSRRTGYSWTIAADAALTSATIAADGGMSCYYMGYNLEMAREFIDYVGEWAKTFGLAAGEMQEVLFNDPEHPERQIKTFRVEFASGFEVVALPSVPRALRGKQGKVIIDEAAFHDDLDGVLKAAFALLIWGGRVIVISTHNGDTHPFAELVNGIRAGKLPYYILRLTFDEAVAQGLYERVCIKTKLEPQPTEAGKAAWIADILAIYADNADEELNVIPSPSTGVYLTTVQLEACAIEPDIVVRWTAPKGFDALKEWQRKAEIERWITAELIHALRRLQPSEAHAFGEDFGRIRDLTVMWVLAIGRDLVRRTRLVVELRQMPYKQQEQVLIAICDRVPRLRALKLDAGGNGGYLAEAASIEYGEGRVEQVKFSEDWYRDHMPRMKAAIEDATFTLPKDAEVIDDFRMIKLVRGVGRIPDRRRDDANQQRHGDAAIAACLAYAASEAEPEEYGYEAARPRQAEPGVDPRWSSRARDEEEDMHLPSRSLFPTFRGGAFG